MNNQNSIPVITIDSIETEHLFWHSIELTSFTKTRDSWEPVARLFSIYFELKRPDPEISSSDETSGYYIGLSFMFRRNWVLLENKI